MNAQEAGRFWKMTKQYVETGIDTFGVRYAYDGLHRLIGAAENRSNEDPLGTASCATVRGWGQPDPSLKTAMPTDRR
ncbi:hypothetical protein [Bryobacter aggregatus]|uniref:hypothetical protein n=1 Tax=Bryobacter aggregatus TaxID=360054 RepID=UPI0004E12ED5|nr:hypothetical protein [Bryobacter aggregatus]